MTQSRAQEDRRERVVLMIAAAVATWMTLCAFAGSVFMGFTVNPIFFVLVPPIIGFMAILLIMFPRRNG